MGNNKMLILLDFDGTVVEHQYPYIGQLNNGCIEVIDKLQKAGHDVLLNTLRCEFNDGSLEQALNWFKKYPLAPITNTKFKFHPAYWNWEFFKANNRIIIDDASHEVPLIPAIASNGYMVDWKEVDRQLEEHGIYNTQP